MKDIWIINISKMDISLSDLNITIPAGVSFELTNKKKFPFLNENIILSSIQNGSIYKKSDRIFVRKILPEKFDPFKKQLELLKNEKVIAQSRSKSTVISKEAEYDELKITDEQYAEDQVDSIETEK